MKYTFLLCSERSGSNLLTKIAGSHSLICAPSPTHLIRRLVENQELYRDLENDVTWHMLLHDCVSLFDTKIGDWESTLSFDELVTKVSRRSLDAVIRYVFEKEAGVHNKNHLFIKEVEAYKLIPYINAVFPEAKFVYLARDPRDMALSWKKSALKRGCVIRAANSWKSDQRSIHELSSVLSSPPRLFSLTYESLITDTGNLILELCNFLGVDFEIEMLEFHRERFGSYALLPPVEWENITKPIIHDNHGKYRAQLTVDEIKYVEAICQSEMEKLCYARDFEIVSSIGELREKIAHLELFDKPGFKLIDPQIGDKYSARATLIEEIKSRRRIKIQ